MQERTYRLNLLITESELSALAILGRQDLRDMRTQARYLLRCELIRRGLLPEDLAAQRPSIHTQPEA